MHSEIDRENPIPVGSCSVPFPRHIMLHYDTPASTSSHACVQPYTETQNKAEGSLPEIPPESWLRKAWEKPQLNTEIPHIMFRIVRESQQDLRTRTAEERKLPKALQPSCVEKTLLSMYL